MTELGEELLSYHRDDDYKIIRLRDDLISAVRYAFMERYKGKLLDGCEPHGGHPASPASTIRARCGQWRLSQPNLPAAVLIIPTANRHFHRTALMSGSYANSLDLGNRARALSGTQAGRLQLPNRFRSV